MTTPAPTPAARAQEFASRVLARGASGAETIGVLTDEEITALDGLAATQIAPLPWLEDSPPEVTPRIAASIALRGLLARGLVLSARDAGHADAADPEQLVPAGEVEGILALRRGFAAVITYRRFVADQSRTLVQYVAQDPILLQEEVTADGFHHFTALPRRAAHEHALELVDPASSAAADGERWNVRFSELAGHPELGPRLGATQALTVASCAIPGRAVEQTTFYAGPSGMLISRTRAEDGTEREDPRLEVEEASAETLRERLAALGESAQEQAVRGRDASP